MARPSLKSLVWEPRFVAIYKCSRPRKGASLEVADLKLADGVGIEDDEDLKRVVSSLRKDFVAKRVYTFANNPTSRVLTFRAPPAQGRVRLDRLLERVGSAPDRIAEETRSLAEAYVAVPGVREGVLIFLVARGAAAGGPAADCLFIFKCDFETISQVTREHLFELVEDAIVEKTKKAALYPYFDRGIFDREVVRVFDELGETQYWLDFLELGERTGRYESVPKATKRKVVELAPASGEAIADEEEQNLPPRSLRDKERKLARAVRLSTAAAKQVVRDLASEDRDVRVSVRLGEVSASAPLSQYGSSWMVAEEGGQAYLLVKGSKLEQRTSMLTALDLIDFPSLDEALAELQN